MPYDLGVIKRQRREPPVISTGAYGGNFVGFYSTGSNYYAVHVFTSSGQFTKPSYVTTTTAQVLVVAGGGGGATASSSGGSLYFNGVAATKLTTPANAVFSFGTGDFTVEAWIYPTASPSNLGQIIGGHNSGSNADWIFGVLATTNYIIFYGTNGSSNITSVSGVPLNQWTHVAVVVAGTIPKIYFNGVLDKTGTSIGGLGNGTIITVGGDNTGNANAAFTGYITNLRVVKGLAVYSGNFTTPNYMLQSTQSANPGGGSNTQAISTASWTSLILDVLSPTGYIADTGGNTLPITNNASTVVYSSTPVPAFISAISGVGGGGGAGGVINSSTYSISTSLTILIGAGGAVNINGNASTVTNGVTVLTASGGGTGGAPLNNSGTAGSSGGGGSGTGTGGANTSTQGNVGGAGGSQTSYAGGGGGASTAGGAANSGGAGQGGSGTITLITGSPIWLAGGGGGGANATGYNNGSYGGGGNGGTTSVISGTAGLPYTGGGGGGGGASTGFGGNGGSGIVIISYAIPANLYPSIQSDPYFSNNSLLLNATTATAGNSALITYSVFTDVSTYGVSVTSVGSTATTLNSFDPGLYHSLYFSGNNYLLVGVNGNYNFIYSTTALVTIEFWVYPASLSSAPFIFSTNAGNANYFGGGVQITSAGNIAFTISGGSGIFIVQSTSAGTIPTNAWSHVAVTWNYAGNTGAFYINGNQSGTFTRGTGVGVTANSSLALIVGQSGSNSNFYNGYVSNLRLVNGTVVYSGIFIPSKEPLSTIQFAPSVNVATITTGTTALVGKFLTTAQTIADYSTLTNSISNVGAVTASTLNPFTPLVNESAYFNGSSQYLAMPVTGSIFELAGSSFTMECWVYIPTSGGGTIWTLGTTGIFLTTRAGVDGNGSVYFQTGSYAPSSYWFIGWNGMKAATPNSVVTNNTWAHIAFVRDSSTFKIFVNGTQQDSRTFIEPNSIAAGPGGYTAFIGSYYGTSFFTGYISNFRLVRGLAVYSGNFTVPTGPLQVTQVANPYGGSNTQAISTASYTSLLTLRYGTYGVNPSGVIDYGSNNNSIVVTGQPAQGTFSPFGNNWSTFFNGTTDYLSIPVIYSSSATLTSLNFGTNNWTMETWAYLTANTGTAYIAGQLNTNNIAPVGLSISANRPVLNLTNSALSSSPSLTITSPTALSTGTWNHIAAVRNATRFSMYVNGVEQVYSFSSSPVFDLSINTATVVSTNVTYSTLSPYDQSQYHSLYFNGSSYLTLPTSAAYQYGTSNFTAEAWIYRAVAWTAQPVLFGQWSASTGGTTLSWVVTTSNDTNGYARFLLSNTGAAVLTDSISTTAIPLNQWNHLALVRNGSTFTLYLNGISVVTYSSALALYAATNNLSIGANSLGTQTFIGYISNLRIVKGLALYSGTLVQVPQTPLSTIQSSTPSGAIANVTTNTTQLLTGRFVNPSRYFFDEYSSNNFVVTNTGVAAATLYPPISSTSTFNSLSFNGTSQYLSIANATAFNYGSSNFTIEAWVYLNAVGVGPQSIISTFYSGFSGSNGTGYEFLITTSNFLQFDTWTPNTEQVMTASNNALSVNTWYHVAVVNNGGTFNLYVNGTQCTKNINITQAVNTNGIAAITVGYSLYSPYNHPMNGYISNLRIVKGVGVYTSNFTVPSTQLTTTQFANQNGNNTAAITAGTSLLIGRSSSIVSEGGIAVDYSVIPNYITSVGNTFTATNFAPPISSTSTYNSLYFDGSTQYLTVPSNAAFGYASGTDFTIEMWIYVTAINGAANMLLIDGRPASTEGLYPTLYITQTTGTIAYYTNSVIRITSSALSINTWYHVALVRLSGSTKLYLNGTQTGSTYTDANTYVASAQQIAASYSGGAALTSFFNGYISSLRIVKGLAVYTGAFTTPNKPLTITQTANPYGGSNVQAISTGTYTSLLTLLPYTSNIVDYSTNTSVITIGSGTVSLSTLDPFSIYTATNYHSIYFGGNSSLSATSSTGWLTYGDHTVEAWVNLNILSNTPMLIAGTSDSSGNRGWEWSMNNYWMTLGYRLSGVLTSVDTTYYPTTSLTQLTTDQGGRGLAITNIGVSSTFLSPITGYYGSLNFASNGTYLYAPNASPYPFVMNGDFTIEMWIYPTSYDGPQTGARMVFSHGGQSQNDTGGYCLVIGSTGLFIVSLGTGGYAQPSTGPAPLYTWSHVAYVRYNDLHQLYLNGVSGGYAATGKATGTLGAINGVFYIGQETVNGGPAYNDTFQGYMNNVRVVNGVAVYTGNFTPPTGNLSSTQVAGTNIQAILTASYTVLLTGVSTSSMATVFAPNTWYHVAFSRLGTTASIYINGVRTTSTVISNYTEQNTLRIGSTATSTYLTGYISNFRIVSGVAVYTGTNFVPPTGLLTTQQPTNPYAGTNTNAITFNTSTRILTAEFNGVNISLFSTATNMLIGRAGSAVTSMFPGYLSNLRIVNGTALYTSAFAPPRAPLPVITNTSLLIAASNTFVDKSANNFIVTTGTITSIPNITKFTPYKIPGEYNRNVVGGSVYFNTSTAASQNLNIGSVSTLALGSGNYTVECWVYAQSYNALNSALIDWRTNAGVTAGVPVLYMLAAGTIQWQNTGGTGFLTSPNAIPLNTWNHVAMVRYNSTLYMYINGVVVASIVDSTTLTIQTLFINSPITASNQTFFGFISNVRILVGRAIYTPTLTVSTTTLTRVTNTVLLALQNDAPGLKDNSTNNFALTKPNTSTVFHQVLSPFVGQGSAYFNGVNNYLTISTGTNQAFNFDVNDFTLEAWVYPTARNGTYGSLIIGPVNYPSTINWIWMINSTGYLYIQLGAATVGTGVITSTSQVPLSQWSHVACVRLYGAMTLYINGQASGNNANGTFLSYAAGSLSFNGTDQFLQVAVGGAGQALDLSSATFTIEAWIYPTTTVVINAAGQVDIAGVSAATISSQSHGDWNLCMLNGGIINFNNVSGTSALFLNGGTVVAGQWSHVAVTRVSSIATVWVNGVGTSGSVYATSNSNANTLGIGRFGTYSAVIRYWNGYITNFRIINGTALYYTNFSPSVPLTNVTNTKLLLLVNSSGSYITDSSISPLTVTTSVTPPTYSSSVVPSVTTAGGSTISTAYAAGSLYFAGGSSNQRLSLAASSAFDLSGGTWTIEFWMYSTATPTAGNQCRMFMFGVNQTTTGFVVGYQNDGSIAGGQPIAQPYVPVNPTVVLSAAGAITLNNWIHVAMVSNAGNATIYINGVQSGNTVALTEPTSSSPTLYIGYDTVGTVNFQYKGYLTNIRIVNGSAVYTSNFTPTLPLTNVPNTKLLLLVNNGYALTDTSSSPMTVTNSASPVTYSSSVIPSVTIASGGIVTATNTINVGIGAAINGSAATAFNGYITNLHVIKGVGKYTGSFTLPTSDLNTVTNTALLTLLSTDTTFIDSSLNSFAITNSTTATTLQGFSPYSTSSWSSYFDGNTYMYVNNAQPFNLSTSTNWTIETWVNPTGNYAVNNVLFAKRNTGLTFKSMSFNGTTQYLSISTSTNAFAFGSNDWTIECWFYGSGAIVGRGPSDADDELYIAAFATGQFYVDWGNTSEYWQSATGLFATNQWTHLAVVRSANSLAVFQNGVSLGTSAGSTLISRALTNNYAFRIGQARYTSGLTYFSGYIANFRVVNGLAVYTGNFNPPTGLLSTSPSANVFGGINTQAISTSTSTTLLIGQFNTSNSISDLSTYGSVVSNINSVAGTVTGPTFYNSIQFNGTNQYLIAAMGASTFGTGDFTVECWFYKTAATSVSLLDNATGNSDNNYWSLATYADGHCQFQIRDSSGQEFVIGTILAALNTWVHVAVTRTSGLVRLFVNGVLDNSATITKTITARTTNIGSFQYTGFIDYFTGYISNVRLVTGVAVYNTSTSFAAPTAPLSKYLPTLGTSSAGSVSFTFVSGAAVDFTNSTFATGTGDFTAECWVYMDPSSSIYAGFMTSVSSSIAGWNICRDFVGLVPANGSGPNDALSWTVPTGVWTHVALTLRSGQVQAWLNGVGTSILTRTYVTPSPSATTIRLAGRYTSDTAYPFVGYISNARFVVGVGVYTGNFTVPTTQLQTTQPSGTNIQAISTASYVRLLTAQTNSIADLSPAATSVSITGSAGITYASNPTLTASAYSLVMNSSYLTIPADVAFQFGTGDFTIECWFYWTGVAPSDTNQYTLISNLVSSDNKTWDLQFYNGNWRVAAWSPTFLQGSASSFTGYTWNHIAVTRVGGNGQIWLNGSSVTGSVAFVTDLSTIALVRVGWNGTNQIWNGYISNVRIVKGLSVYSGTFTTPTSMLRSTQIGSTNIQSISTASYVSLLTGQSNVIVDNSKNNFSITNVGVGVGVASSISPFATSSVYNASYTTLLTANFIGTATSITDNSNNNYTIILYNSPPISVLSPFGVVYATTSTSYQGYLSSSTGYLGFYNGTTFSTSTTALSTGTWNHVAYTYDSSVSQGYVNIYVNGFRVYQTTATIRADASENFYIGGVYGVTENFYGYLSNFRVVKDSSLYLGSYFGVPGSKLNITTDTIPYPLTSTISTSLLTLQDNRIVDNSINAYSLTVSGTPKTITFSPFATNSNISAYFNGTSDFINVQAQAALSLGIADFTIEVWVYPTAVPTSYAPVIDARAGVLATPWIVGMITSGGVLKSVFYDGTTLTAATTIQLNVWTHLAWSRTNSILRMFVNGAVDYTSANHIINLAAQTTNQFIGKMWNGTGYYFQGYMSNLRVVNGRSLYTGNFTPSQIPLTQASGGTTNLLTTFVDTKSIDYSGNTAIRSTTSTFNLTNIAPKYNLYSMNFNGTSDILTVSSSTGFVYNSNDFTWEMWVYPTSPIWATTSTYFIEHGINGGSLRYANNKVFYSNITTATSTASFTLSINSSTWTHLAVVRASNVTSVFINGAFTVNTLDTYRYNTSTIVTIGNTSTNASNYFQGYIEDLRITKGIARYLTTFVPPTKLSNR